VSGSSHFVEIKRTRGANTGRVADADSGNFNFSGAGCDCGNLANVAICEEMGISSKRLAERDPAGFHLLVARWSILAG
jgi:hypothetical protein